MKFPAPGQRGSPSIQEKVTLGVELPSVTMEPPTLFQRMQLVRLGLESLSQNTPPIRKGIQVRAGTSAEFLEIVQLVRVGEES